MNDIDAIFKDIALTLKNLIDFNAKTNKRLEKLEKHFNGDRNESKK